MKTKREIKRNFLGIVLGIVLLVFTAIFLISSVKAWGVAGLYTEQVPLEITPGETETITFQLQNMIGEEDITIVVKVLDGSDYVEIIGPTQYTVPIGTHDTEVKLEVTAPQEEGNYPIRLSFETVSTQTGGVAMETAMERKFTLISTSGAPVPPETEQEGVSITSIIPYAIAAILIIVILLTVILRSKKKRKTKTRK